ncbi:MAG: DUF59 domain-containing protein [Bacteroidales bacterium]|nr:DUF59 domain-containing protein [Bacteroidales bacterium]
MEKSSLHIKKEIVSLLKNIYDPEIPVNLFDLGLIYDIEMDDIGRVKITMTLTAPNCPVADDLLREVKEKTETVAGVREAEINLVFDPPWDFSMLSDEARLELGML